MSSSFDALIDALLAARRGPAADAAPLARALVTADDAYLAQAAVANELDWFADGPPRHWKSGGASRTAVPAHAPLPPAGVWASPAEAGGWPFHQRGIEAEIALRLGRPVDAALAAGLDLDAARGLVDAMAVSIEVVDSRWQQAFQAPALLRMADVLSHGALVLGEWVAFTPRDWLAQACRVRIGDRESRHVGTHSCWDPCWVLVDWLRHASRDAEVPAGTVVTTGTWCGMLPARAGESVSVDFDGIGEARLQL